jgi:hypothetical protein
MTTSVPVRRGSAVDGWLAGRGRSAERVPDEYQEQQQRRAPGDPSSGPAFGLSDDVLGHRCAKNAGRGAAFRPGKKEPATAKGAWGAPWRVASEQAPINSDAGRLFPNHEFLAAAVVAGSRAPDEFRPDARRYPCGLPARPSEDMRAPGSRSGRASTDRCNLLPSRTCRLL